jgi:hypothetical protein
MHCVKLHGKRLSARGFDRHFAEFQVRVAVLNGFTALSTPITEGRRIGLSWERGRQTDTSLMQQSPAAPRTCRVNWPWGSAVSIGSCKDRKWAFEVKAYPAS